MSRSSGVLAILDLELAFCPDGLAHPRGGHGPLQLADVPRLLQAQGDLPRLQPTAGAAHSAHGGAFGFLMSQSRDVAPE